MFSAVCLSSRTVGITIYGTSRIRDSDRPVVLTDKPGIVTDRTLSKLTGLLVVGVV